MSEYGIFLFALTGRLLDIISTRLLTPKLALEGNRIAHKYGWLYAWATLSLSLVTFVMPGLGIMVGTASCLMAWSNMSFVLISRYGLNEYGLRDMYARAVLNCDLRSYVVIQLLQFLPLLAVALMILLVGGFSPDNYSSDIGYGILIWIVALSAHKSKVIVRKLSHAKSGCS